LTDTIVPVSFVNASGASRFFVGIVKGIILVPAMISPFLQGKLFFNVATKMLSILLTFSNASTLILITPTCLAIILILPSFGSVNLRAGSDIALEILWAASFS